MARGCARASHVSSGFGRALAQEALAVGHRVVGTVRSGQALRDFASLSAHAAFGRVLDVTDFDAIDGVVSAIEADVGPIDVLVNNAGYGHEGIMEESPLSEMRRQFDVNVFGAAAMMKAVLPFMRDRWRGRILNITSMGGHITMPGIAYYCASKFALEGPSEALGKEVQPFGIAVTAVAPGSFRTDWAGRSSLSGPHRKRIANGYPAEIREASKKNPRERRGPYRERTRGDCPHHPPPRHFTSRRARPTRHDTTQAALGAPRARRYASRFCRASSHIALMMPNASATPMPRIQLKYHMIRLLRNLRKSCERAGLAVRRTRRPAGHQYIECRFSSSARGVTLPRSTRYTQPV